MSALHTLEELYAAIDAAVHTPSPAQPTKVTAPALGQVLRLLATELLAREQAAGSGGLLTAPNGTAYRLTVNNAGRLLVVRATDARDVDAAAFCAAAGLEDDAQQQAVAALVISLKNSGVWAQLHALYPLVGGTERAHALNLKDPRDEDDAYRLRFVGQPQHSALGVAWNGQNQYADTYFRPAQHLPLISCHLAYYVTNDDTSSTQVEMGCVDGNGYFSLLTNLDGRAYFENNQGGQLAAPVATGRGFTLGTRLTANQLDLYRDGQAVASGPGANPAFPDQNVTLGARSGNYNSRKTCGFASVGAGLTAAQAQAYSAAVRAFQQALGRDVAPAPDVA